MAEISFEIQDFSRQVLEAEKDAIEKALYVAGIDIVGNTVEYMSRPDFTGKDIVDTGKLRQSISFITSERQSGKNNSIADDGANADEIINGKAPQNQLIWGSNVQYANYVNSGTVKQKPRKFLENGFYRAKADVERHIEKVLKGEL